MSLCILYASVYIGVYYLPIELSIASSDPESYGNPVVLWTILLLVYCFFASVLPVWLLLQPRDLINSQQLLVALVLLIAGLAVAGLTGKADLVSTTEAISTNVPSDAPPLLPFLFITIACGAWSGFHCLVSSGTSSKQVSNETHAQSIGYGAMLLESGLAVLVILACTAGVGMGAWQKNAETISGQVTRDYSQVTDAEGVPLVGRAAWQHYYRVDTSGNGWRSQSQSQSLSKTLSAFVEGGANFLTTLNIPMKLAIGIVAVLVACFAATTLDTATRLQRYVLQELGSTIHLPIQNKYVATTLAVGVSGAIAIFAGKTPGSGGGLLWPLFGATNQLLAGLALMVATFYLWRRGKTIFVVAIPALFMLLVPGWAMIYSLVYEWYPAKNWILVGFGSGILVLQLWMFAEGLLVWRKARGVLEPQLPPLNINPGQA